MEDKAKIDHNFIEDNILVISRQTIGEFKRFVHEWNAEYKKMVELCEKKKGAYKLNYADLLALYIFYYDVAKWQRTNQPKATTYYVAQGLNWTETRVRRHKKALISLNVIEDIVAYDNVKKRISGHYIRMKYLWKKENVTQIIDSNSTPDDQDSCSTYSVGHQGGNALSVNKEEEQKQRSSSSCPSFQTKIREEFWKQYRSQIKKPRMSLHVKTKQKLESATLQFIRYFNIQVDGDYDKQQIPKRVEDVFNAIKLAYKDKINEQTFTFYPGHLCSDLTWGPIMATYGNWASVKKGK